MNISSSLNVAIKRAAILLGYVDFIYEIQTVKKEPNRWEKEPLRFPALRITIAYVQKGSHQERALLQQIQRKHLRSRRQDIYDIAWLIQKFEFDDEERKQILDVLHIKASSRNIHVHKEAFANPMLKALAQKEWDTMSLELEMPLPSFEESYQKVQYFYASLPW